MSNLFKFTVDLYFYRKLSDEEIKLLTDRIHSLAEELFGDDYEGWGYSPEQMGADT